MRKSQSAFTVERASELTGIAVDKIVELARLYAKGPSSLALGWGGNDKMGNADVAGHAAALLVAITGNIGKPGAGRGRVRRRHLERPDGCARRMGAP